MKAACLYGALLAGGVLAAGAQAQSDVGMYGIVDAALVGERGGAAGKVNKLTSGASAYSRLGFRGKEELGGGLSAVFLLELGMRIDDGSLDNTNGQLFNRQAYIGLESRDWGSVRLGRQHTFLYYTLVQVADPFSLGYAGTAKNLFPVKNVVRTSNTISYTSPARRGWTAEAAASLGEQAADSHAGRQLVMAIGYAAGPLTVRLAHSVLNQDVAASAAPLGAAVSQENARNSVLAMNYRYAFLTAYLAYGVDKGANSSPVPNPGAYGAPGGVVPSTDSTDLLLGASIPAGKQGRVMTSFIRKHDRTPFQQDASQWALGYTYALSPRTSAYLAWAKIRNRNGAAYTVGNGNEAGSGNSAFNLGLRHNF